MNHKAAVLLIHIPVWVIVISLAYIEKTSIIEMPFRITSSMLTAFWILSSFYVFYSYLVPKYLENGKYLLFSFYALLVLTILPILYLLTDALNFHSLGNPNTTSIYRTYKITLNGWLGGIQGTLFCGAFGLFYRFSIDWFRNLQIKKDLENKNLKSELKILKAKLNPHLLFNTLNNIDTLIQSSPEQASEVLSKLSDLLRYVVYDTEYEKVSLKMEVDSLIKYIDIEKIRLVNPDSVSFRAEISGSTFIPPMIFFPFVENGFKHSNLNNKEHKLSISISEKDGIISFQCINNIMNQPRNKDYYGIGLELAKKRLELLFPNKHELVIQHKNNEFIVKLQINTI